MTALRLSFHHLVNADLYPEVLPFALRIARDHLARVTISSDAASEDLRALRDDSSGLEGALELLPSLASHGSLPWHHEDPAIARRRVVHYMAQYAPTALIDGCWIQRSAYVGIGHTALGAQLTAAYVHQVEALDREPEQRFVHHYAAACKHVLGPFESVGSRSFSDRVQLIDASFELPLFLLSIGQFPRSFLPEIVGLNLAWHLLEQPTFAWHVLADTCASHTIAASRVPERPAAVGRESSLDIARTMLSSQSGDTRETWQRMWSGIAAIVDAVRRWSSATAGTAPDAGDDPRKKMIAILERKARHAAGYHRQRRLGAARLDDRFRESRFDPERFLDDLAESPYVIPGDPESSSLVGELTSFGGSMYSVFAGDEVAALKRWIASLNSASGGRLSDARHGTTMTNDVVDELDGLPSSIEFRAQSEARYGGCPVRQLYYHLVNVETYPDVLPVAMRFARDRLARARADLTMGERPIPSLRFSPAALTQWVETKHRQQVDSYVPFTERPRVSQSAFIEATVQLAPLILIDGSWLQGFAGPLVHRTVGSLLFGIFYEEVGQGDPTRHHANIYRDLLTAMGEAVPAVCTRDFAEWPRFRDASFDVPVLWMCLSGFPRHFMPEILGLNLAVELAGVGGPYLEAHDTLKHFGYPTLFVDVHNAADNICEGHAASATKAIVAYMDEVAASQGPDGVDEHWHRVWSGVRGTLPHAGPSPWRSRMASLRRFRRNPRAPLVFPS